MATSMTPQQFSQQLDLIIEELRFPKGNDHYSQYISPMASPEQLEPGSLEDLKAKMATIHIGLKARIHGLESFRRENTILRKLLEDSQQG